MCFHLIEVAILVDPVRHDSNIDSYEIHHTKRSHLGGLDSMNEFIHLLMYLQFLLFVQLVAFQFDYSIRGSSGCWNV